MNECIIEPKHKGYIEYGLTYGHDCKRRNEVLFFSWINLHWEIRLHIVLMGYNCEDIIVGHMYVEN